MKNPDYKETKSAWDAVKAYLDKRAAEDKLFAVAYAKPGKSLDECYQYILNEARKRGQQVCMSDEEVYGLAVHYYDEDNIVVPKKAPVVRTTRTAAPKVELSEEEKAAAREAARKAYEQACLAEEEARAEKRRKAEAERKAEARRKKEDQYQSASLFDFAEL